MASLAHLAIGDDIKWNSILPQCYYAEFLGGCNRLRSHNRVASFLVLFHATPQTSSAISIGASRGKSRRILPKNKNTKTNTRRLSQNGRKKTKTQEIEKDDTQEELMQALIPLFAKAPSIPSAAARCPSAIEALSIHLCGELPPRTHGLGRLPP